MLEVSPNLQLLLLAAVTFLVTEGLKALGGVFKLDLSGAAAAITAAVVGLVLLVANGFLGQIPPEYAETVRVVMDLIVAIFGAFGLHKTVKRF